MSIHADIFTRFVRLSRCMLRLWFASPFSLVFTPFHLVLYLFLLRIMSCILGSGVVRYTSIRLFLRKVTLGTEMDAIIIPVQYLDITDSMQQIPANFLTPHYEAVFFRE